MDFRDVKDEETFLSMLQVLNKKIEALEKRVVNGYADTQLEQEIQHIEKQVQDNYNKAPREQVRDDTSKGEYDFTGPDSYETLYAKIYSLANQTDSQRDDEFWSEVIETGYRIVYAYKKNKISTGQADSAFDLLIKATKNSIEDMPKLKETMDELNKLTEKKDNE